MVPYTHAHARNTAHVKRMSLFNIYVEFVLQFHFYYDRKLETVRTVQKAKWERTE